jgi:hypothetical protein
MHRDTSLTAIREAKTASLAALEVRPADALNRLFFAARNLAIESMLRGLEVKLLRLGFPAECEWSESSFGGASLYLRMLNTGAGSWDCGTCAVRVDRSQIRAPDCLSGSFYEAKALEASEYWPRKEPAKLLAFREAVQAMWDSEQLQRSVLEVNYPFYYPSHSSF